MWHFHNNNRHFADIAFLQDIDAKVQMISYCGVKNYFQNGITEKWIRGIQEQKRKQIHNYKSIWLSAIEISLWPYMLLEINKTRNTFFWSVRRVIPKQ